MIYTVKQLAEKLEVTKATITNNAKNLDLELKKVDNVIQIDENQAELISQRINKNKQVSNLLNKSSKDISISFNQTEEATNNKDLIEILKQQIDDLKQDKTEYIKQVNNLNSLLKQQQTLLSQQQSLQLQSNEKIKVLEIELQEAKHNNSNGSVNSEIERCNIDVNQDNAVDEIYKGLREDKNSKESFISKLFKRF